MWIYLSDAFLSVVQDTTQRDHLLVRARIAGDIETVFPFATVTCSPERDYAYRASLPRAVVADAIERSVRAIDYPNFKASVHEQRRHDAYLRCWSAMLRFGARHPAYDRPRKGVGK
jgi:hypothetical protein